ARSEQVISSAQAGREKEGLAASPGEGNRLVNLVPLDAGIGLTKSKLGGITLVQAGVEDGHTNTIPIVRFGVMLEPQAVLDGQPAVHLPVVLGVEVRNVLREGGGRRQGGLVVTPL